ncbi:hypothetical protein [Shewanella surugensis]|uniref:Uncharacterized protein n=1 Tax=Shewanella surugensis TaxID=212020 RepID=A0ABT0L6T2_9GAMM|nr:hypothetical protein [Shewanella surugensis]MCL1123398.1 hypothetical protein [Shewanella surugensis]
MRNLQMSCDDSIFKQYEKYRQVGMELNNKFLEELDSNDMKIALRALGVLKNNKVSLSADDDMDRCYDFMVHDYKNKHGQNLVSAYWDKNRDVSQEDSLIIKSCLSSTSSLYEVISVNCTEKTIELHDLMHPDRDNIHIVDFGLSSSQMIKNFILYSRIIEFNDFNMTSGSALVFDQCHKDILLAKYKKKMNTVMIGDNQTKLAAAFFKLYQQYGYTQMGYKEVID